MTLTIALTVAAGALAASFVAGLAGFGTAMVALGFWLHVLDPRVAIPLSLICSVVAHVLAMTAWRGGTQLSRLWPFLLGGLLGVPLGVLLLGHVEANVLRAVVGIFLLLYCSVMLSLRRLPSIAIGGRLADGAIGFGGGVLGGVAGLSGPLPTIWCSLKGWDKNVQRGVFQGFNLAILAFALISQAVDGIVTGDVLDLAFVALPAVLLGSWLGAKTFGRVNDQQFRRIVLWLLMASGLTLTVTNLF